MEIRYYGHAAFQISLQDGKTILFDPYRNLPPDWLWFLDPFPALAPNYVIITHPHFDHDAVGTVTNAPTIIRDPFRRVDGDAFSLTSLLDHHAKGFGADYGAWNIIFTLESEGIRFCHWGDNQPLLTDAQWAQLGEIDILTLPIEDGAHLLELDEVEEVILRLKPRIVMPAHYHIAGITNPDAGLTGIEGWLARQANVRRLETHTVALTKSELPRQTEAWVFPDDAIAG